MSGMTRYFITLTEQSRRRLSNIKRLLEKPTLTLLHRSLQEIRLSKVAKIPRGINNKPIHKEMYLNRTLPSPA